MAKRRQNPPSGIVRQNGSASSGPETVLREVFGNIPIAGDDFLDDLLGSTSDRTVTPAPLAVADMVASPATLEEAALPEDLGEEVPGVTEEYIRKIEDQQRRGKTLDEAERVVQQAPQNTAPPAQPAGGNVPGSGTYNSSYDNQSEPPPLTPLDVKLNAISADQIVKWYDVIQSLGSVWAYDYFSSPKQAGEVMEALSAKITGGKATQEEIALYKSASEVVLNYTTRKTRFAESVAMSEGLKQQIATLLGDIMEARGVTVPPELLLGFLFLTPLIVNGGRILLEKMGFKDADQMVGQFTQFTNQQYSAYKDRRQ